MTNREKHQELWQRKRSEQHIKTDVQADWSEMNNLLDTHMPVSTPGSGSVNTGGQASTLVKGLTQLAKYKLFYVIGGLLIAGAITYSVIQNNAATKNDKQDKTEIRKDSVSAANIAATDSLENNQAPLSANTPAVNNPEKGNINTNASAIDNKANSTTNAAKSGSAKSGYAAGGYNNGRSRLNSYSDNNRKNSASSYNPVSIQHGNTASDPMSVDKNRSDNTFLQISAPDAFSLTRDDIVAGSRSYSASMARLATPVRMFAKPIKMPGWLARLFSPSNRIKPIKASKNPAYAENSKRNKSYSSDRESSTGSNLDWGILAGVNASGSFTSKAQNHNIYGSLSPDIYLGLFGNYNISDNWAVGFQARVFTPHTIKGTYNYTHHLKADTSQTTQVLEINDSRKVYTVDVPLYAIYKVSPNFNLKAGAILSLPVKQVNGTNSFIIYGPLRDSVGYYNSVTNDINASSFDKKLRVGASLGIGYTYKFFWVDATYNFQGQRINSALGSYSGNTNSLQLTIGIKFNKSKP